MKIKSNLNIISFIFSFSLLFISFIEQRNRRMQEEEEEEDVCEICYYEFSEECPRVSEEQIKCTHTQFHLECLSQHFKPECPLCRAPNNIEVTGEHPESNVIYSSYQQEEEVVEHNFDGAFPYQEMRDIILFEVEIPSFNFLERYPSPPPQYTISMEYDGPALQQLDDFWNEIHNAYKDFTYKRSQSHIESAFWLYTQYSCDLYTFLYGEEKYELFLLFLSKREKIFTEIIQLISSFFQRFMSCRFSLAKRPW